jgi:hypothetical protein
VPVSQRIARAPGVRESAICAAVLIALAVVTFAPQVRHGGFYSDDWAFAVEAHFEKPTYFGAVRKTIDETGGARPVLSLFHPVPHILFPQSPGPQIALGLALGIATCLCFFVLLRMLGMRPVHATLLACMALVFPWADAIRLWVVATLITIAVLLFFVGVCSALAGLARTGRRSVVLHGVAVACYAASVLAYQVASVAAFFLVGVYLAHAPPRRALRRAAADVVALVIALAWSAHATRHVRHVASLSQMLHDVPSFLHQGTTLFADALLAFPGLSAHRALEGLMLLVVAVGVAAAIVRIRRSPGARRDWLVVAGASLVFLVLTEVVLLGSFLHPLDHGIDNRGNVLTAFAYVPLVYASVMLLAGLTRYRRAETIGVVCICLILFGWVLRVRSDEGDWVRSARLQSTTLATLKRELPELPSHSSVVAVSFPGQTAPEVPVFEATWDLAGALQLTRRDQTLEAFPVFDDDSLTCGPRELVAAGKGSFGRHEIAYGRLYVASPTGHRRVTDRASCQSALAAFPLGPRTN